MQSLLSFGLTALGGVSAATAVVAPVVSAMKQGEVDQANEDKRIAESKATMAEEAKTKAEKERDQAKKTEAEFNQKLKEKPLDKTEDVLIQYYKTRTSELMSWSSFFSSSKTPNVKCTTQTHKQSDTF